MNIRIDEIDERIIYRLTEDARHTSAPDISRETEVSPPTIRNRIRRLEDAGVIKGYHARIDYEKVGGRLTNLFLCTAVATERKRYAQRILDIPGIVGVREVMTGEQNIHVTVVGADTGDIRRIAREMAALGIHIDDEGLFHREHIRPFAPFGPSEPEMIPLVTGIADLSEEADLVELPVASGAPIAGLSLREATENGLLTEDLLVISLDRAEGGESITPDGDTIVRDGDVATLFSRTGIADETLRAFTENISGNP